MDTNSAGTEPVLDLDSLTFSGISILGEVDPVQVFGEPPGRKHLLLEYFNHGLEVSLSNYGKVAYIFVYLKNGLYGSANPAQKRGSIGGKFQRFEGYIRSKDHLWTPKEFYPFKRNAKCLSSDQLALQSSNENYAKYHCNVHERLRKLYVEFDPGGAATHLELS